MAVGTIPKPTKLQSATVVGSDKINHILRSVFVNKISFPEIWEGGKNKCLSKFVLPSYFNYPG